MWVYYQQTSYFYRPALSWLNDWQTDAISDWPTAAHVGPYGILLRICIFVTAVVYSR